MANFINSLKALISPQLTNKAAAVLGEKDSDISTAVSSIMSSFLGVLLKNGNTPQIRNVFEEAGNLNILAELDNICEERPTQDQQRIGDDFLQHLLGDKAADFTNPIAEHAGISKVATNRLVSMLAPVFAGFLGNKLVKENRSMHQLFNEIEEQKNSFAGMIPSDLIRNFGLSSILRTNSMANENTVVKKKSNSWIIWIVLILLLLLLFFWWRSCRDTNKGVTDPSRATMTDTISQGERMSSNTTMPETDNRMELTEMTLSNGMKIQVYKGGVEEKMIQYLNSDDYRNATEDDLKDKWFTFDNIAFEFDSSTRLRDNSQNQLNNIVQILKSYPNAKIKVAGFADKKGTEEANMKISQERAKTIESLLERGGVGSQVVRTEGYGDEFAKHSANESDATRAEDRDIALRFVKQ